MHIAIQRLASCLLTFGAATPAALLAADWPTEAGDNLRSAATSEKLPIPLSLQWTYQAPAAPKLAWSSAEGRSFEGHLLEHRIRFDDAFRTVVVGRRVYFGSTVDHQLHCRDLDTGKLLWTCYTGGPIRLSPTVADGRVSLAQMTDGLIVPTPKPARYCGSGRWRRETSGCWRGEN